MMEMEIQYQMQQQTLMVTISFVDIPAGNYILMEVQPTGYENVSDEDTSDDDAGGYG